MSKKIKKINNSDFLNDWNKTSSDGLEFHSEDISEETLCDYDKIIAWFDANVSDLMKKFPRNNNRFTRYVIIYLEDDNINHDVVVTEEQYISVELAFKRIVNKYPTLVFCLDTRKIIKKYNIEEPTLVIEYSDPRNDIQNTRHIQEDESILTPILSDVVNLAKDIWRTFKDK